MHVSPCPLPWGRLQAAACVLCLVRSQRSQEAKFILGGQGQVGLGPPFLLSSRQPRPAGSP